MSKVLAASCENGVVTVAGQTVDATILGDGIDSSTGILIIENEECTYLPKSTDDIRNLIDALGTIIEKIALIATGLDAVTVSPGTQAANITSLTLLKTNFVATKDTLI